MRPGSTNQASIGALNRHDARTRCPSPLDRARFLLLRPLDLLLKLVCVSYGSFIWFFRRLPDRKSTRLNSSHRL